MFVAQAAPIPHLPALQSKDLNGRELTLPHDLPGERTLLIVAFEREQQSDVDTWTTGLKLAGSNLPWFELPVIENPGALARWFISGGMRRGIKDQALWQHVVTLYTRKADFKTALGITSEKSVQVLVVDRQGQVLERVIGDYSAVEAGKLMRPLRPAH